MSDDKDALRRGIAADLEVADMIAAMALLARLRSSVFAFGTDPAAWAEELLHAGLRGPETSEAVRRLALRSCATDRIELGDIVAEVRRGRATERRHLAIVAPFEAPTDPQTTSARLAKLTAIVTGRGPRRREGETVDDFARRVEAEW